MLSRVPFYGFVIEKVDMGKQNLTLLKEAAYNYATGKQERYPSMAGYLAPLVPKPTVGILRYYGLSLKLLMVLILARIIVHKQSVLN